MSATLERIPERTLDQARNRRPLSVVLAPFVSLKRAGKLWQGRCPFHKEKTPSFLVYPDAHYHCFGCGAHGDAISALMQLGRRTFHEAVRELLDGDPAASPNFETRFRQSAEEFAAAGDRRFLSEADQRSRQAEARAIWHNAKSARGTLAETYLRRRAVSLRVPKTIRFAPALYHSEGRGTFPALVAALQDGRGYVTAVQRIWLNLDGSKAKLDHPKKTKGPMLDGAVRLAKAGAILGIAEGIETGLSAMQIYSLPVWVSLGAQRMKAIRLPDQVEEVMIFRDNGDVGFAEAVKAAEVWEEQGRRVMIEPPPAPHKDWNDALAARGIP